MSGDTDKNALANPWPAPRGGLSALLRAWLSTSALFASGLLVPIAGTVLMIFTPQPGLSLERREGRLPLLLLIVMVAAGMAVVAGPSGALVYVGLFGFLTLTLAAALRRDLTIDATVAVATLAGVGSVSLCLLALASPEEILEGLRRSLESGRQELLGVYRHAGVDLEAIRQLEEGSRTILDAVVRVLPALTVIGTATIVLANLGLFRARQRLAGDAPVFGDLTRWKCPPTLVWGLLASGYSLFLPWPQVRLIAFNVFAVVLAVYFCQGLVIVHFYARRWRSPLWITSLLYIFVAVEWLLATGIVLLGAFDLWADFRRLEPRPAEED